MLRIWKNSIIHLLDMPGKAILNREGFFVGLFLILKEKCRVIKAPGPDGPAIQTFRTWKARDFPAARHVFIVFLCPKERQ
jgi:hypothetical protein